MDWRLITCLVCTYGFLKQFRPSDAYLTRYLYEDKNMTIKQIDHVIYPWHTYFYLFWLVPVLLLTDVTRYKPMVILDSLARVGTWAILLWTQGFVAMKISQIVFGLASAASTSYYAYIYASVSVEHFQKVTGWTHWAELVGKFLGYLVGQLFVSFNVLDLYYLNLITFVDMCAGFLLSLAFPKVTDADYSQQNKALVVTEQHALVNDREDSLLLQMSENKNYNACKGQFISRDVKMSGEDNSVWWKTLCWKLRSGSYAVLNIVRTAYASRSVKIWSLWWTLTSCGYFLVSCYIQNIWATIDPHREHRKLYNGAVEAAGTLLASFSVLVVGLVRWDWSVRGRGEGLLAIIFSVNAISMVLIGTTKNIWIAYVLYDIFRATYHAALTLGSVQISKAVTRERYGFVFGCNSFVTLVIETIFTVAVIDKSGLNSDVGMQFVIYGGYFGLLAVIFFIVSLINYANRNTSSNLRADDQQCLTTNLATHISNNNTDQT